MVNRAILLGYLGSDPDLRYTQGGAAVAKFSLATKRVWSGRDGQKQEETAWHTVVVWNKTAENCAKYLNKGSQAYVEGEIRYGNYEKDGTKRYFTEIVAHTVQFIGQYGGGGNRPPHPADQGGQPPAQNNRAPATGQNNPPDLNDIPF